MPRSIKLIHDIITWTNYFHQFLRPEHHADAHGVFNCDSMINGKVSLWKGDITELSVDAIVNAANSHLNPGGGVDGAIHAAAGPELSKECQSLDGCAEGDAKITKGYNLPAKFVIHAVGPSYLDSTLLESAYQRSLDLAVENGLRTIAFPCISTGVFGYPRESAAHVALRTTRHFLEDNAARIDRVVFVMFLEDDAKIYEKLMQRYFPIPYTATEIQGELKVSKL